jgi:hypothetical protein
MLSCDCESGLDEEALLVLELVGRVIGLLMVFWGNLNDLNSEVEEARCPGLP